MQNSKIECIRTSSNERRLRRRRSAPRIELLGDLLGFGELLALDVHVHRLFEHVHLQVLLGRLHQTRQPYEYTFDKQRACRRKRFRKRCQGSSVLCSTCYRVELLVLDELRRHHLDDALGLRPVQVLRAQVASLSRIGGGAGAHIAHIEQKQEGERSEPWWRHARRAARRPSAPIA